MRIDDVGLFERRAVTAIDASGRDDELTLLLDTPGRCAGMAALAAPVMRLLPLRELGSFMAPARRWAGAARTNDSSEWIRDPNGRPRRFIGRPPKRSGGIVVGVCASGSDPSFSRAVVRRSSHRNGLRSRPAKADWRMAPRTRPLPGSVLCLRSFHRTQSRACMWRRMKPATGGRRAGQTTTDAGIHTLN